MSAKAVALWLTGLWVAGVLGFMYLAGKHPADLELNALGDFLAGAFAPLAFLWLVVAVWIQSQELSLQRDELAATRAEMKEQKKVAEEQVKFIETQTNILRTVEDDRRTARQDEYFYEHIDNIIAIARHNTDWLKLDHEGHSFNPVFARMKARNDLEGFGANIAKQLQEFVDVFADGTDFVFTPTNADGFLAIHTAFKLAKENVGGISSFALIRYQRYGIDPAIQTLDDLEKMIEFGPDH